MRARSVSDGWMEKHPFPATRYSDEKKSLCEVERLLLFVKLRHRPGCLLFLSRKHNVTGGDRAFGHVHTSVLQILS